PVPRPARPTATPGGGWPGLVPAPPADTSRSAGRAPGRRRGRRVRVSRSILGDVGRRRAIAGPPAPEVGGDAHVLSDGQVGEQLQTLEGAADASSCSSGGTESGHIVAVEKDPAGAWGQEAGH